MLPLLASERASERSLEIEDRVLCFPVSRKQPQAQK